MAVGGPSWRFSFQLVSALVLMNQFERDEFHVCAYDHVYLPREPARAGAGR
jgi:hypothetical protein